MGIEMDMLQLGDGKRYGKCYNGMEKKMEIDCCENPYIWVLL